MKNLFHIICIKQVFHISAEDGSEIFDSNISIYCNIYPGMLTQAVLKEPCVLFAGSVAQLLDSLDEVEILSQAKKNDIDFLHHFLDNNKFQSLLEVRLYIDQFLMKLNF